MVRLPKLNYMHIMIITLICLHVYMYVYDNNNNTDNNNDDNNAS